MHLIFTVLAADGRFLSLCICRNKRFVITTIVPKVVQLGRLYSYNLYSAAPDLHTI